MCCRRQTRTSTRPNPEDDGTARVQVRNEIMTPGRARRWLLAGCTLVLADLVAAQVLVRMWPQVDLTRDERNRLARLEHEAVERQYRVRSAVYDHDLVKQFDGVAWWGPLRYHVTTNSLGFRDATTRTVPLETHKRRLLLFGDSFTEGLGLDYAETYAGLIAARLAAATVDVLNAAVTSYSPAIYYAKARYLLEDVGLQCTEVVVFIDISDAEDEARHYDLHVDGHVSRMIAGQPGHGPEYAADEQSPEPVPPTLAAAGLVSRTIETALQAKHGGHPPTVPRAERTPGRFALAARRRSVIIRAWEAFATQWQPQAADELSLYPQTNPRRGLWTVDERDYAAFGRIGLERAARHMDRLAALLRKHRITLIVAVYPWPDQLRYDRADSIHVRYWRRWAERRGARFVDLFEPLFRDPDRNATIRRYYIAGDIHFNKEGSRLIATTILEKLATAGKGPA
jgi:lysophospholipase L1-like esterase